MALAMIEGAERDGLLQPGDDRGRVHGRQHRPGARARVRGQGLPRPDRHLGLLQRRAPPADAGARRRARRDPGRRGQGATDRAGHREHGRARRRARPRAGHVRDRPVPQPVHHPRPQGDARPRDLGGHAGPRHRVLPRDRHRGLAHRRLAGAARAQPRRPDRGARAGRLARDHRRPERLVRDAGLDGRRPAALGSRPPRTRSGRSRTTRRSR